MMNDVTITLVFACFNQGAAEGATDLNATGTNEVIVTNKIIRIIK